MRAEARLYGLGVVLGAILSNSAVCQAQTDTLVSRALAPGVAYRQFVDKTGPLVAYLIRVDLRNAAVELQHVRAHDALKAILQPLNYKNLDEIPDFKGVNTTTEFLTRHVHDKLAEAARAGKLGRDGRELKAIRVTISESHVARASYEADLW